MLITAPFKSQASTQLDPLLLEANLPACFTLAYVGPVGAALTNSLYCYNTYTIMSTTQWNNQCKSELLFNNE
jgi:hypothetical protein